MPYRPASLRSVFFALLALLAAAAAVLALGQAPASAAVTGTVSGVVTFGTVPASDGIEVHLYPVYPNSGPSIDTVTDVDGHYEFTGVTLGNYNMSIWGTDDHPLVQVKTFALTTTTPTRIANLVIPPFPTGTSSVSGVITDALTGLPIDGASAQFWGNQQAKSQYSSVGPDGAFSVTGLPAGGFSLFLSAPGYVTKDFYEIEVGVGEAVDRSAGLTVADSMLTVNLTDENSDPVPDQFFQLTSADGGSPGGGMTDEFGTDEVLNLGAGEYTVTVGGRYSPWVKATATVTISAGSPGVVDLQLEARPTGATVRGNINNAAGANLAGICTDLWNAEPDPADPFDLIVGGGFETDATGNFEIPDVDAGRYTIMFWDCSTRDPAFATTFLGGGVSINSAATQTFTVAAGVDSPGHDINLKLGASISGHINLMTGDGIAELPASRGMDATIYQLVNGVWEEAPDPSAFVGEGDVGDYTANGLPAGTYRVGFADRNSPAYLRYQEVYWPTASSVATATNVVVTSGQRRTGINATVAVTPPVIAPAPAPESDLTGYQEDIIDGPDAAKQGDQVTITVGAEHAGEWVSIWGHSTPTAMTAGWVRVGKTGTVKVAVPGSMITGDHKLVVQNASNGVLGWSELGLANGPYPVAEPGSISVDGTTSILQASFGPDWPVGTAFSTYQWYRGATAITGATGLTYTLQAADAGKQVRFQAAATVPGYSKVTRSSTPIDYSITKAGGSLTISGVARFEQTLSVVDTVTYAALGSPVTPVVHYQWLRNGVPISLNGTDPWYQLVAADLGKTITVKATATLPGRVSLATVSTPTALVGKGIFTTASTPPELSVSTAPLSLFADLFNAFPGGGGTFTYQWFRSGVLIPGATTSDYAPTIADAGKTITAAITLSRPNYDSAKVTYVGHDYTLVPSAPLPAVSGRVVIGDALTVVPRTYTSLAGTGATESYQWLRNGVAIAGETGPSYTPTAILDTGKAISVRVTATDPGAVTSISTSAPTQLVAVNSFGGWATPLDPAATTGPATLTAPPSGITEPGVVTAYQWFRGDVAVAAATKSTYALTAADYGKQVWVRITVSKALYTTVVKSSPRLDYSITADAPYGVITDGTPAADEVLSVNAPAYSTKDGAVTPVVTYQWLRNGAVIANATTPTYRLQSADFTTKTSVRVTASAPGYVALVATTPVTAVIAKGTISGDFSILPVVTINPATNTLTAALAAGSVTTTAPTLAYQWLRNGVAIAGATTPTFKLTAADYGKNITVRVTVSKLNFLPATVVLTSAPVDYSIAASLATITSSGAPNWRVGDTLTADSRSFSTKDGAVTPVLTYQWLRNGAVIAGATGATYDVQSADYNTKLSVRVTATLPGYVAQVSTSVLTPAIIKGVLAVDNTMKPIVTTSFPNPTQIGTLRVALAPGTTTMPAPELKYQWLRDGVAIPGATQPTWNLSPLDYKYTYSVKVTVSKANTTGGPVVLPESDQINWSVQHGFNMDGWTGTGGDRHPKVGDTLTLSEGDYIDPFGNTITPTSVTRQWVTQAGNIAGATGSTLYVDGSLADMLVSVKETATYPGLVPFTLRAFPGVGLPGASYNFYYTERVEFAELTGDFTQKPVVSASSSGVLSVSLVPGTVTVPAPTLSNTWLRNGSPIPGQTGATYQLTAADNGAQISVRTRITKQGYVRWFDIGHTGYGSGIDLPDSDPVDYTLTSNHSLEVEATAGLFRLGSPMTATVPAYTLRGDPVTPTRTYQWLRNNVPIAGATSQTYTPVTADLLTKLSVRVTAVSGSAPLVETSPQTIALTKGVIEGTLGQPTVTVDGTGRLVAGLPAGTVTTPTPTLAYQWLRNGVVIAGGTAQTYPLVAADYGKTVSVRVTVTKPTISATAVILPVSAALNYSMAINPPLVPVTNVALGGTVKVGGTLSVTVPAYKGDLGNVTPTIAYQWLRNGAVIAGATTPTYVLKAADLNTKVSVRLMPTAPGRIGTFEYSEATQPVGTNAFDGTRQAPVATPISTGVAPTLTAELPAGSVVTPAGAPAPVVAYQWFRSDAPIAGATGQSYTMVVADYGAITNVRITITKPGYTPVVLFSERRSFAITVENGLFTQGDNHVGGVLSTDAVFYVDNSTVITPTVAYQWLRDGVAIPGETGPTYTAIQADFGHDVSVRYSPAYAGYLGQPHTTVATPIYAQRFGGTWALPEVSVSAGGLLTATLPDGSITPTDYSVAYQWFRELPEEGDSDAIPGATASTYQLVAADEGAIVRVVMKFTKELYDENWLYSAERSFTVITDSVPAIDDTTPEVDDVLTATAPAYATGTPAYGTTPETIGYQWLRDGAEISGATSATYTVIGDDIGAALTVRVTASATGCFGSVTVSAPTSAVPTP